MSKCIHCGREYHREGGDILMPRCDDCRSDPSAPEAFVTVRGIVRPNPAYDVWKAEDDRRKLERMKPA